MSGPNKTIQVIVPNTVEEEMIAVAADDEDEEDVDDPVEMATDEDIVDMELEDDDGEAEFWT